MGLDVAYDLRVEGFAHLALLAPDVTKINVKNE